MNVSRRGSNRPASLASTRLVSRSNRKVWARDLVWFHIDELNGLFDGLQHRPAQSRLDMARSRTRRILVAATWNRDEYRKHAWDFVMEGLERPEDAFGPAVLLTGLGQPPSSDVLRWLREVSPQVSRTIELVGLAAAADP